MRIHRLIAAGIAVLTIPLGAQDSRPAESAPVIRDDGGNRSADSRPAGRPANRLAREKSPYLRQHATNPVDWYPWGPEALAEAKRRNCPIFISVGYSACHWCHVMEEESFVDAETAALMNRLFVNVKIDREERPDLDAFFQNYVRIFSKSAGGWPASIWLTPDEVPIWAATYYPDAERNGVPSFRSVCEQLDAAFREKGTAIAEAGARIIDFIGEAEKRARSSDQALPPIDLMRHAAALYVQSEDKEFGGFEDAPKFPRTMVHGLLFTAAHYGEAAATDPALRGLLAITRGGIHDHIGGGFHRYATDKRWRVPHFEKMLYDQAAILDAFVSAWLATRNPFWKSEAEDLIRATRRDFFDESAQGFVTSWDADSAGVAGGRSKQRIEGAFYTWTMAEMKEALGEKEAAIFARRYGATDAGNWPEMPGRNVLEIAVDRQKIAETEKKSVADLEQMEVRWRETLRAIRDKRPKPAIDKKIVTEENGMVAYALVRAARAGILETEARDLAVRTLDRTLGVQRRPDGSLFRRRIDGESSFDGVLGDYAWTIRALALLGEWTADARRLEDASALAKKMIELFGEPAGGFYESSKTQKDVRVRAMDAVDGAVTSRTTVAIDSLTRLGALLGERSFADAARRALATHKSILGDDASILAAPSLAAVVPLVVNGPLEIVVIGDPRDPETAAMRRLLDGTYLPDAVILVTDDGKARAAEKTCVLLRDRASENGRPRAFVCRNGVCAPPVATAAELRALLERERSRR